MAVSLQKGQKVDLTKGNAQLNVILIGLGWDPIKQSGGFLGGLFGGKDPQIDCDASVLMLAEDGKLKQKGHIVFYNNLNSPCASVRHMGDNLTGDGEGDDEQVVVQLDKVPADIHRIVFVVTIYDCANRKQHFGMIRNCFIRVVDANAKTELLKYNLTDDYSGKTALIVGELYRHQGFWKFGALGEGTLDTGVADLVKRYV